MFIINNIFKKDRVKLIFRNLTVHTVMIIMILLLTSCGSVAQKAINIIRSDLNSDINVIAIYHFQDQDLCLVRFSKNGIQDSACVHLDNNTVGYKSVWDKYANVDLQNSGLSSKEQQQYAQNVWDYPYSPVYEFNIIKGAGNYKRIQ